MKQLFFLLIGLQIMLFCKQNTSEEILLEEPEELVDPSNSPEYKRQLMAYDVSYVITLYKEQIEPNEFIINLDLDIKEGMYKGYDIEYFHFHEFNNDILEEMYSRFFNEYPFFSLLEQERIKENSQIHQIHTWNSKKKELALLGEHLKLLKEEFGEDSELFQTYKKSFLDTSNLLETLNNLKKQKILTSNTANQKNALLKILSPLLQLG